MTRPVKTNVTCPHCNIALRCPNCGQATSSMTPFSQWLRALPAPYDSASYDNQNLDYIWFNFRQGWLITMEEKRFGARQTVAQADTQSIVAQMLAFASGHIVTTLRGRRKIEYRGHFLIVFQNTTPDDSEWITVNGEKVSRDELLELLQTGKVRRA